MPILGFDILPTCFVSVLVSVSNFFFLTLKDIDLLEFTLFFFLFLVIALALFLKLGLF